MKTNPDSAVSNDLETLAAHANSLLNATSHLVEEKIVEARYQLATALDKGKGAYGRIRERVLEGVKAADDKVRENPYKDIAIAFAVGLLFGGLLSRKD